jgi:hypothetical protein
MTPPGPVLKVGMSPVTPCEAGTIISGVVDDCECEFSYDMKVTRVRETPSIDP